MTRNLLFILIFCISGNCLAQSNEILESYCDSIRTKTGELYIISLESVESTASDDHLVHLHFLNDEGTSIDTFTIFKDPYIGCEPRLYDYNGDGSMDYSFVSSIAARGANEVRSLFIFDPEVKRFRYIVNSEDFPNLIYNPRLKCMDSWAFHGGTTQSFLKLESDSLVATYTIDVHGFERVLGKYENGKWIILKTDSIADAGFPRYLHFDPFEEYKE